MVLCPILTEWLNFVVTVDSVAPRVETRVLEHVDHIPVLDEEDTVEELHGG